MGTYGNNPPQQGDVLLYQSLDGGDITCEDGIIEMTGSLATMAYLALYGGNDDDPGGDDKSLQFWGNWTEPDITRHYRSEWHNVIKGLPATSANLLLAQNAAQRDLESAFIATGIANKVTAIATIPSRNKIKLYAEIEARGERSVFAFTENWEASV